VEFADVVRKRRMVYEGVDKRPRGSAYSLSRRPLDEMVHRNRW
jgi:hypothetical protein